MTGRKADVDVLYVDNDREFADLLARWLEQASGTLSVTTEARAVDALARLADEAVDCVVSAYQMPGMDGVEFLQAVREDYPDLPFVLVAGTGSEAVASEAVSAGVTDYLRLGQGDLAGVLAVKIRTAVERRRAVERFETFLASAPDGIVIVDRTGEIEYVNEQAEALFGYDRDELVGRQVERLVPERFRDSHADHREAYLEAPETRPMGADLDLYARHADGSEFPVDVAISPIEVGGRLEVMAGVRDISTRKWREHQLRERQRELERQNERLDAFASAVSHDLRGPLGVVDGNLRLARETGDLDHLDDAEAALDRMGAMIDDLLTLAREGEAVRNPGVVSLQAVVDEAWTTVGTDDAVLRTGPAVEDATLQGDRERLRQVFENLFRNAVEHGSTSPRSHAPEDAAVTVRVSWDGAAVAVSDDGPGIPPERRDAVFEHGYSTSEHGTGFGLAIVETIVEAHGWDIRVTESDAGGTRFEITVDRDEAP